MVAAAASKRIANRGALLTATNGEGGAESDAVRDYWQGTV